jgi:hypothetical protein
MQIRKKLPILKKKIFTNGVKNIIRQLFAGESHQAVKINIPLCEMQCSGSKSIGFVSFWAPRIHNYFIGSGSFHQLVIFLTDVEYLQETAEVIKSYGDQIVSIQQPDQSEPDVPLKEAKFKGYFKIAR